MSEKVEKIWDRHMKLVDTGRTAWTPAERDRCALLEIIEGTFDLGKFDLELSLKKQAHWSLHTFGGGRRTVGLINHIKSHDGVRFQTMAEVADEFRKRQTANISDRNP